MKTGIIMPLLLFLTTLIAGCSDSGSAAPAQTFSATITDIQIKRTADQLDMSVTAPPEKGAVISVR